MTIVIMMMTSTAADSLRIGAIRSLLGILGDPNYNKEENVAKKLFATKKLFKLQFGNYPDDDKEAVSEESINCLSTILRTYDHDDESRLSAAFVISNLCDPTRHMRTIAATDSVYIGIIASLVELMSPTHTVLARQYACIVLDNLCSWFEDAVTEALRLQAIRPLIELLDWTNPEATRRCSAYAIITLCSRSGLEKKTASEAVNLGAIWSLVGPMGLLDLTYSDSDVTHLIAIELLYHLCFSFGVISDAAVKEAMSFGAIEKLMEILDQAKSDEWFLNLADMVLNFKLATQSKYDPVVQKVIEKLITLWFSTRNERMRDLVGNSLDRISIHVPSWLAMGVHTEERN
jgi:hypothetical protein